MLEDDTETTYQVGEFYSPSAEGGLRYSDPRLKVAWPLPVADMSDKDRAWRVLEEAEPEIRAHMTLPVAPVVVASQYPGEAV